MYMLCNSNIRTMVIVMLASANVVLNSSDVSSHRRVPLKSDDCSITLCSCMVFSLIYTKFYKIRLPTTNILSSLLGKIFVSSSKRYTFPDHSHHGILFAYFGDLSNYIFFGFFRCMSPLSLSLSYLHLSAHLKRFYLCNKIIKFLFREVVYFVSIINESLYNYFFLFSMPLRV